MTFDKKLKILNCLTFGEYITADELLRRCPMNVEKFKVLVDSLGVEHYIGAADDGSGRMSLFTVGAKYRYLRERRRRRFSTLISLLTLVISLLSLLYAVFFQ